MNFNVSVERNAESGVLTIKLPNNSEVITSVAFESDPNVGTIREALMQKCELGKTACGASVDIRNYPTVTCPELRCPFQPNYQKL